MEWNLCWNGKNNGMMDVTPFLLFESTGDSEEVKAGAVHDHEEATMDESDQAVLFQFDDDDDDDDAQSCSYDHSSYIVRSSYGNYSHHDQTQGLIHYHFDEDDSDVDNDNDDDDNWGESNMMDQCMQQKRSRKLDSSNQREIDRNFWETCLAT